MRRNIYVVSSLALAIIIVALVSVQPRLPSVMAKTGEVRPHDALADSSISLAPQDVDEEERLRLRKRKEEAATGAFWIPLDEEARYAREHPRYLRVFGGFHADGTKMYVCRGVLDHTERNPDYRTVAPGKLYRDKCYYPWNGKELIADHDYEVLRTPDRLLWQPIDPSWHRTLSEGRPLISANGVAYPRPVHEFNQLSFALDGGQDQGGFGKYNTTLYMCRKQLKDGTHLGKYSPFYHFCYIPWGGKELRFSIKDGFDILLVADPGPN